MTRKGADVKVGVYVDAENVRRNGGRNLRYDVLREFAIREGGTVLRLNTYVAIDEDRMRTDPEHREGLMDFLRAIRASGWKTVEKKVRYYFDEKGNRTAKANADLDMAVDMLLQCSNLDKIILVTGDGDFIPLVKALQDKGLRVELLAFRNVSSLLRRTVDFFLSGFLIPGLVPLQVGAAPWGEIGSRVRAHCHSWKDEQGYGFFRFMKTLSSGLWVRDTRLDNSPYVSVFVHKTEIPEGVGLHHLREGLGVFEFTIAEGRSESENMAARDITLVAEYS